MTEDRLARIEQKVDDVAKAIVQLARMEERMITLFNRMDSYDKGQTKITERLTEVEKTVEKKATVVGIGERFTWLIVGALIVGLFEMLKSAGL